MAMKNWVIIMVILCFISINCFAQETPKQIAQNVFPSVVSLFMEDSEGQRFALGGGFFVQEGIVATNLHVIEGAMSGYAKLVGQPTEHNIEGTVAIDDERDLVLLSVPGVNAPAVILGDSDNISVGDAVYVVGNPYGLEGTFTQGIVSGIRETDTTGYIQITAAISSGNSGGPVLDSQGEVIGVAVASLKGGQNLNFAIPSSYLSELLSKKGQVMPLSMNAGSRKSSQSAEARTEAQRYYDLGISYIKSDLYEDGLKTLNQVAFLYPESDVADNALYQLALIRELVGDGKLVIGESVRIETVREEMNRLSNSNMGSGGGVIVGYLQAWVAHAKGDAAFDVAKQAAIAQYILALDYLNTLSERHRNSDMLEDAHHAFRRIEGKISPLMPKQTEPEEPREENVIKTTVWALIIFFSLFILSKK